MKIDRKICKVCGSLSLGSEKYCDCGARLYDYMTISKPRKQEINGEGEE